MTSVNCLIVQLSSWRQLNLFVGSTLSGFCSVYVFGNNFVLCFYGNKDVLQMPLSLRPKLIQWNRTFCSPVLEILIFYLVNSSCLIGTGIHIIIILNQSRICKSYCQGIHCMVAMIISFGPILNLTY